jgi:aminobenzoyl-glutamate transport protein
MSWSAASSVSAGAGIGPIFAVMLPYVLWLLPLWTLLFAGWYLLGIPWGF